MLVIALIVKLQKRYAVFDELAFIFEACYNKTAQFPVTVCGSFFSKGNFDAALAPTDM